MTSRMPRGDRYSYEKLDSDGNWVYDMPTSVAATGQMFDQRHTTPHTAPLPPPPLTTSVTAPPPRENNQYIYPDPANASYRPAQPYFEPRHQHLGGEKASLSPPRNLNPRAPSFFAPPKRASETLRQETEHKRRASCQKEEVPRVVADNRKVRPSPAARRASKSASASHARLASAHQHSAPRYYAAPSSANPRTLQEQIDRSPLAAKAEPVSVTDWTSNQINAYHPGVGHVRARLPPQPGRREGNPIAGTSSELRARGINEPFPCRFEGCKSKHKPYMHQGQLTKHMIVHQPDKGRSYQCDQCECCFRYPRELERHLPTHKSSIDRKDQFSCSECSASFGRKDNLQRHVKKQHAEPSMRFGLVTPPRTAASSSRFNPSDFPPLPPPTPPRSVDR